MVARRSKSPKCELVKHLSELHRACAGCLSTSWLNLNLRPGLSVHPQNLKFVLYYKTSTSTTSPPFVRVFFLYKYFIYTIEFTTGSITNRHARGEIKYKSEYTIKSPYKDEKIA